jgi:hypothetical protein
MSTLIFDFVFVSNASPQVVLTSTELTGAATPTVNISRTAIADGAVSSIVASGALVWDSYTKSWHYRLASADLAIYSYLGMATTTYATASPASVHARGIVMPDELISTRHLSGAAVAKSPATLDWSGDVTNKPTIGTSTYAGTDTAGTTELLTRIPDAIAGAVGGLAIVGSLMGLTADAITAAAFDEATAYPLKSADTGSTQVARKGADADTLETLSDQLDILTGGAGALARTIDITDNAGNPLDGVEVWVTTDLAGAHRVAAGSTNTAGAVTFLLDAGTYYVWAQAGGWSGTNPTTITVV